MKTRSCFVSNSSSSSFIVQVVRDKKWEEEKDHPTATEEQQKLLLDYGFRWTRESCPSRMEMLHRWSDDEILEDPLFHANCEDENFHFLGFQVSVNEDDVKYFLVKHGIPFKAACHYGHYHTFYAGKGHQIVELDNHGMSHEMYGSYDDGYSWKGARVHEEADFLAEQAQFEEETKEFR